MRPSNYCCHSTKAEQKPGVTKSLLQKAKRPAKIEVRVRREFEAGGLERLDQLREIERWVDGNGSLDDLAVEARRLYAFNVRSPESLCAWAGGLRTQKRLNRAEAAARKAAQLTSIESEPAPWVTIAAIQRDSAGSRSALMVSIETYVSVLKFHRRDLAALVGLAAVWLDLFEHFGGACGDLAKAKWCLDESGVSRPRFDRILSRYDRLSGHRSA